MEKFLLIASLFALHLPFGLFRDTARRFENFARNGRSDNFIDYCLKNNINIFDATEVKLNINNQKNPILQLPLINIALLIGLLLGLLPLFQLLNWKWYFIILLNLVITFILSQILAFIITPNMKIYSISKLYTSTFVYLIIGLLCYGISFLF